MKPSTPNSPGRNTAAWLGLTCALVGGGEGLRTVAYLDPVGIPTGCFGETEGVRLGMTWTVAECSAKLGDRITRVFGPAVDRCAGIMPPERKAAHVSLAYNVGTVAYCNSTAAKLEWKGDAAGACQAITLYNKMKIAGVLVYSPGLANRRGRERDLCMRNLSLPPLLPPSDSAPAGLSKVGA